MKFENIFVRDMFIFVENDNYGNANIIVISNFDVIILRYCFYHKFNLKAHIEMESLSDKIEQF